jgi:hypothetical protein
VERDLLYAAANLDANIPRERRELSVVKPEIPSAKHGVLLLRHHYSN